MSSFIMIHEQIIYGIDIVDLEEMGIGRRRHRQFLIGVEMKLKDAVVHHCLSLRPLLPLVNIGKAQIVVKSNGFLKVDSWEKRDAVKNFD